MSDLKQRLFIVQSPTRHSPSSEWMRYKYLAQAISKAFIATIRNSKIYG
jgi:hypothetical protein